MIPAQVSRAQAAAHRRSAVFTFRTGRRLNAVAWAALMLATVVTFAAFMTLDPDPSPLLAACAAFNVAILMFVTYRLYRWDLLLSPMASAAIGPGLIVYYSWGNLGARIAGEGRYGGNPGSLEFYPIAAMLSSVGLALFVWMIFGVFARQARYARIRYQDLHWHPWQALAAASAAGLMLLYLSLKYPFVNGYFVEVESNIDRWLSASQYFFVLLAVYVGVSVMVRSRRLSESLLGLTGVAFPLLLAIGLRSRTSMLVVVVTATICWLTLRPKQTRVALVAGAVGGAMIFGLGTVVKLASLRGGTESVADNLVAVSGTDLTRLAEANRGSAAIDVQYRTAGFEMPAALIGSLVRGAEPMYGQGLYGGLLSSLPGFIRPAGDHSERLAIFHHFFGRGLIFGDSIGLPLTSGIADWGVVFGPVIYLAIAAYCLFAWRVVQISPRVFVAYLMAGLSFGDLFWENGLFAIRAIGFAWIVLWLTGPLLMPRWLPTDPTERRKVDQN